MAARFIISTGRDTEVDVLIGAYAFTNEHLKRVFDLAARLASPISHEFEITTTFCFPLVAQRDHTFIR